MTERTFTGMPVCPQDDVPAGPHSGRLEEDACTTTFANVLVGVDSTSAGRDAIALGETLRDSDGRTTLAHVVRAPAPVYRNFGSTPVGKTAHDLLVRQAAATGASADLTGMFAPSVGAGLHQLATDHGADLLVVGRGQHGGVVGMLHGNRVVPVAVAPRGYGERPLRQLKTIGLAYDGGPESEAALGAARRLAARDGAALMAVTVVSPTTTAARLPAAAAARTGARSARMVDSLKAIAQERLRSLVGVDGRVAIGSTADELIGFGDQVDLLVVGSRGRGALRRALLGSTSALMVRSARCPVLVVLRRESD